MHIPFGARLCTIKAGFGPAGRGTILACLVLLSGCSGGGGDTPSVNNPPLADAGVDQSVNKRATVTLDGSGSHDPDGDPLTLHWMQTAGASVSLNNNTLAQPSFIAPDSSASLIFSLVANDGEVDSSADTVTINVINHAPSADAGQDQGPILKRSLVTLDGSASSDSDDDPLTYSWSQTGGEPVSLSDNTAAQPGFTAPDTSGALSFALVVNDGEVDSAAGTVTITVINNTPVADAGLDQTVRPGRTVQLDGSNSLDPDADSLSYSWVQTSGTGVTLSDAGTVKPTFTAPGSFQTLSFELIVNDGETASLADSVAISVFNTLPSANAGPDASYNGGETAMLDGSASSDPDGDVLNYRWTQTGGSNPVILSDPAAEQPLFAVPNADDTLTFSLVVCDGFADSVADTISITTLSYTGSSVSLAGHPFRAYLDTPHEVNRVKLSGHYAYLANSSDGLRIVDVSNPLLPVFVASYDTPGASYDVDVVGDYAYVADYAEGLQIVDISNPASPVYAGSFITSGTALGVVVAGDYAYVAAGSSGLQVIDISDPSTPALAGSYDTPGYAEQLVVTGQYAYVTDQYSGLLIIDISNPASPALVTGYSYNPLVPVRDVSIAGNHAYLAYGAFGVVVVDISDPVNPVFISQTAYRSPSASYGSDVAVVGYYAYVADYYAGLYILDMSDPLYPVVVAHYDTPGNGLAIAMGGDHAYVADGLSGLSIIDVRVNALLTPLASYPLSGSTWDVVLAGHHAYVADGSSGLQIVDVSNPLAPVQSGSYNADNNNALGISVVDHYAFMAGDFTGLHILDISNPVVPLFSGNYDSPGRASKVALAGTYAYLADQTSGLQVVDVSDTSSPTFIANYATSYAYDVELSGHYAYVADGSAGLQIIDISDPASPAFSANFASGMALGTALSGHYAYLADESSGLRIIDVSDPFSPTQAGVFDTPGLAFDVEAGGNYAYVADGGFGVQIVDIADPANPFLAGSYEPLDQANSLAIGGEYLFVADGRGRLVVVERLPLLDSYYTAGTTSTVLGYAISWLRPEDVIVDCRVTSGSCAVTSVDQSQHTATLEWTLPALPGGYEITFVVGNPHFFITARDRVNAE